VPFPPNYGGVIDVFYKIKKLKELGVKIYLHTFEYGKGEQKELLNYCEKVYYYKRNTSLKNIFSKLPYIVKTRNNSSLTNNLLANTFPILFEGLHTTSPLLTEKFKNRKTIVRTHNIEHNYYQGLSNSETNIVKKLFFKSESLKLKKYQELLNKVNYILTISPLEHTYFLSKFHSKAIYTPVFHQFTEIESTIGKGSFALYHGDLRVSDNIRACYFLIKVFSKINYQLIIAGSFKDISLLNEISKYSNISFYHILNFKELKTLLQSAQINVLPTFQNTGIKLKLLNALYLSRFCIVNNKMIMNTGLESICTIANSKTEFIEKINTLSNLEFTNKQINERKKILQKFNTLKSTQIIIDLIN